MSITRIGRNGANGSAGTPALPDGGSGGAGQSIRLSDLQTDQLLLADAAFGGSGGAGGTAMVGGHGGDGGAGGAALARVADFDIISGDATVSAGAYGGSGGAGGMDGFGQPSGRGGAGGAATAKAAASSVEFSVDVLASSVGGHGGDGHDGGAAGVAQGTRAAGAGAGRASVSASQVGGAGGGAYGGTAGNGADSTLHHAVDGMTSGGNLGFSQYAEGGAGGFAVGSRARAGAGGNATSTLLHDDLNMPAQSVSLVADVQAAGGNAGVSYSAVPAGGGNANAIAGMAGTGYVRAVTRAVGGAGSTGDMTGGLAPSAGGNGGDANATSAVHVLGDRDGDVMSSAEATAVGGNGGSTIGASGDGSNNGGDGGGAQASALAVLAPHSGAVAASASATVLGGSGGIGYALSNGDVANGGSGASVMLSDAVDGSAPGGLLILNETAMAGNGGSSQGGVPGAAGDAQALLEHSDTDLSDARVEGSVTAVGGTGGSALGGWFAAPGPDAAKGGDAEANVQIHAAAASASATAVAGGGGSAVGSAPGIGGSSHAKAISFGTVSASSGLIAYGGAGGAASFWGHDGAAGGSVTEATSRAVASEGPASASLTAIGGDGGTGREEGSKGGAGGGIGVLSVSAVAQPADFTSNSAFATLAAFGGNGGFGDGNLGEGGDGASVAVSDALFGQAPHGLLSLSQSVYGGNGGGSYYGNAGSGGDAFSQLEIDDSGPGTAAITLMTSSSATGGATQSNAGANTGGDALAINMTIGGHLSYAGAYAQSNATGGQAAYGDTAGDAEARTYVTGSSVSGGAAALGGNSLLGSGAGSALADAVGTPYSRISGGAVSAVATSGQANAGAVRWVSSSSTDVLFDAISGEAFAWAGWGGLPAQAPGAGAAVSSIVALPEAGLLGDMFGDTAVGIALDAPLAAGSVALTHGAGGDGSIVNAQSTLFAFIDSASLAQPGVLAIGFVNPFTVDATSIQSVSLSITSPVGSYFANFGTGADAMDFFNDQVVTLGAIDAGSGFFGVTIQLAFVSDGAGAMLGTDFLLGEDEIPLAPITHP